MKKSLLLLFSLLCCFLMAEEPVEKNYVPLFKIRDVKVYDPQGPDKNGPSNVVSWGKNFLLYDYYQGRFLLVSDSGAPTVWKEMNPISFGIFREVPCELIVFDKYLLMDASPICLLVFDLNTREMVSMPISFPLASSIQLSDVKLASLENGYVIFEERNSPRYHSFHLSEDPTKSSDYLNPEETKRLVIGSRWGENVLRFDQRGFLFSGERLLTRSASRFIQYVYPDGRPVSDLDVHPGDLFVGTDSQGNYYWSTTYYFRVYGKDFSRKTTFVVPTVPDEDRLGPFPFLDTAGHIYGQVTDTRRRFVELFFLKRDW